MKQSVPANFLSYIRYLLSKGPISTRALNRRLGKSSAYISRLLGGHIKSIEYDTAYNIVKILAPDIQNIDKLLNEKFNIEPDEVILQKFEHSKIEEEKFAEVVHYANKLVGKISNDLMNSVINKGDIERVELFKSILDLDLSFMKAILKIRKYPEAFTLLDLFVGHLQENIDSKTTLLNLAFEDAETMSEIMASIKEGLHEPSKAEKKKEVQSK